MPEIHLDRHALSTLTQATALHERFKFACYGGMGFGSMNAKILAFGHLILGYFAIDTFYLEI
jgi:hypothetical protein